MAKKIKNLDWAYLEKFKDSNTEISTRSTNENRIVFLGDSIIAGWQTYNPLFFSNNTNINRGIDGQTTPQLLLRFRPDVIALQPKIVILQGGINDIAGHTGAIALETILGNLISMCELSKANNIRVILCSLLPTQVYPWRNPNDSIDKIETLNTMLRQYAQTETIAFIDFYSAMVDNKKDLKTKYTDDGIHPNYEGYLLMESLLQKTIANY